MTATEPQERAPVRPAYLSQADLIEAYRRIAEGGGWFAGAAQHRLAALQRAAGVDDTARHSVSRALTP